MKSFHIIYNPTAGGRRRRRFERAVNALRKTGSSVTVTPTTGPGHARQLAEQAEDGLTAVVAAGGDGTINEVVNGLLARPGGPLPLGVVPLGTANVLAGEVGLPIGSRGTAETLAFGIRKRITLGRVNGRYFVMMAGVGFDARVVAGLAPDLKRRLGKVAYAIEAFCHLFGRKKAPLRVAVDGTDRAAASVVIANGHYYAGRYVLAPQAQLFAPHLDVCLFPDPSRLATWRYTAAVVLGRIGRQPDYRVVPARSIRVIGNEGEPVQADGDIVARLPVEIETVPDALELLVPA